MKRSDNYKYHTYDFLKKRKYDPKWRERYLEERNKRLTVAVTFVSLMLVLLVSLLFFLGQGSDDEAVGTPAKIDNNVSSSELSTDTVERLLTDEEIVSIFLYKLDVAQGFTRNDLLIKRGANGLLVIDNHNVNYEVLAEQKGNILYFTVRTRTKKEINRLIEYDIKNNKVIKNETVQSNEDFSYAVPVSEITDKTFYFSGVNNPLDVHLAFADNGQGQVSFTTKGLDNFGNDTVVYTAVCNQIPTTEIRIFSAAHEHRSSHSNIRTVKVNTAITLIGIENEYEGSSNQFDMSGPLYVFYNKNGGISLITPNYAGNVTAEYADVMQEVLSN